jgi:hypothetical protein
MRPYVKRSHMRLVLHPSCGLHHAKEYNAQHLERLDPKREVELEGTFTNHLADAIRASDPTERQQAVDKATEAYEDALDEVLYEIRVHQHGFLKEVTAAVTKSVGAK